MFWKEYNVRMSLNLFPILIWVHKLLNPLVDLDNHFERDESTRKVLRVKRDLYENLRKVQKYT